MGRSCLSCLSLHNGNHRGGRNWHQIGTMGTGRTTTILALLGGLALGVSQAQQAPAARSTPALVRTAMDGAGARGRKKVHALSSADRRAVIASALRSKTPRIAERDCSHLVYAVYRRAGFPYTYATSDDLYDGVEGFQRVSRPKPGDLVVWRGHVGIVIRPSQHAFFSFLHAGPAIDNYKNRYWVGRGQPRFYRYLKNAACVGCTLARGGTGE
jgi:cell wall-associated NlpC family hydrolase